MKEVETISTIRRRVASRVSRMSPEQARAILAEIAKRGSTIYIREISTLTGGYNSQNINFMVQRKLGVKAGYVKNPR